MRMETSGGGPKHTSESAVTLTGVRDNLYLKEAADTASPDSR